MDNQLGNDSEPETDAVDAVVTWVDGADSTHTCKRVRMERAQRFSILAIPGGRSATRFASSDELAFCLLSIRKNCSWIRQVFLVTDGQKPSFLDLPPFDSLGVQIVDHAEIFSGYEWALPTFNSQSIEMVLHRIDGLAERFVYFNDDVIVMTPSKREEYFVDDHVSLRGRWKKLPKFGRVRVLISALGNHVFDKIVRKVRSMAELAQIRGAQLAGMQNQFLLAPHVPHPIRVSTLEGFFQRHPDVFVSNIGYRFRDMRQFAPVPLANHLELRAGGAKVVSRDDDLTICFNRDPPKVIEEKISCLQSGAVRVLCLQGFEKASSEHRKAIIEVLDRSGLQLPSLFPLADPGTARISGI